MLKGVRAEVHKLSQVACMSLPGLPNIMPPRPSQLAVLAILAPLQAVSLPPLVS